MRALARDEVRGVDRAAIETVGIPGPVLMENAGRQVTDAVCELLGAAGGSRVAVLAGGGNNGGDGFVVARHLDLRGTEAVTFLVAPRDKLTDDAALNLGILDAFGLEVRDVGGDLSGLAERLAAFDVLVDAVGGTGIKGALRGAAGEAVEQINAAGKPVVAVDIPTGLDCDTGSAEGPAVRAKVTVTFVARKKGFDAAGAAAWTGEVRVADIGVNPDRAMRIAGGAG